METNDGGILSAKQVAQLRADYPTPKTAEEREKEKREAARLRKQAQRTRDKQKKAASSTETEAEWWERNRALLPPEELQAMQAQDAICRDHILIIGYAKQNDVSLDDLNFIFDKDCVSDLVAFVQQHGVAHLGAITRSDEIPKDWSSRQYWKQPALLAALEQEGPQTAQYIRYGLLVALPDWRVVKFLKDRAGWDWQQAADLVGYYEDGHTYHVKHR